MEKTKSARPAKTARVKAPAKSAPLAHGVGRRKSSVARVWLRRGKGAIMVNGKEVNQYFDTDITRTDAATPFKVCPMGAEFDVDVNVRGGGLTSQAGAVKLGIARAFVIVDERVRPVLREHGLLTVDSRLKERKKYGQKAARRKFQFVKR